MALRFIAASLFKTRSHSGEYDDSASDLSAVFAEDSTDDDTSCAPFAISLDGYAAALGQDLQNPLGAGGLALHDWTFPNAPRSLFPVHEDDMTKWRGWVLTALPVLFLAFDATVKVFAMPVAIDATVALGYAANLVVPIGIIQLLCLVLYVLPRTAVLGAVLLTGYLGGAVATQLRAGNGPGQYLFPIVVGALLWGALWVRDSRVRVLLAPAQR